jgi:hypothetical protein
MRRGILVLSALTVIGVACTEAGAACVAARLLASRSITGESYLFTPGGPFGTDGLALNDPRGQFWSAGYGNPSGPAPPNNDCGRNAGETSFYNEAYCAAGGSCSWLENGYEGYGAFIEDFYGTSHWNTPGTDGCIDFDGSDGNHIDSGLPDPDQCTVVLIDDDDDRGVGYFLFAAQGPDGFGTANYYFNEAFADQDVSLVRIPVPVITQAYSITQYEERLTVVTPCPTGVRDGLFLACDPETNERLSANIGTRLYMARTAPQVVPSGMDSRDLPTSLPLDDDGNPWGWVEVPNGSARCGEPATITITFDPFHLDDWISLCASLRFDDDPGTGPFDPEWETTSCSANSIPITIIHAQPADPVLPRDKPDVERRTTPRGRTASGAR